MLPPHFPSPTSRSLFAVTAVIVFLFAASAEALSPSGATRYIQLASQLPADDLAGHLKLAKWCQDNELPQQAAEHYRRVLQIDPDHEDAYAQLMFITDTHRLPEDDARQAMLQAEFGNEYKLLVTEHFLIMYNSEENWARNRAGLLEKAHDVYYKTFRDLKYRPLPLEKRLVCLLFKDHASYKVYISRADPNLMSWAAGYFSFRHNRSAFYHDRDNPSYKQIKDRVSKLEKACDKLIADRQAATARNNFAEVQSLNNDIRAKQGEIRWYENRLAAVSKLANTAKTIHEAIHQLAYNSGVQKIGNVYPFWLSEGMATNFETSQPTNPFGPMNDNPGRRKILTDALDNDQLIPLEEFVAIDAFRSDDRDKISIAYSQSWALFRFLFRTRRPQMQAYLKILADADPGRRSAEKLREEFVEAFGPMDQITSQWKLHLKTIQKPIHTTTEVFKR